MCVCVGGEDEVAAAHRVLRFVPRPNSGHDTYMYCPVLVHTTYIYIPVAEFDSEVG